jgi:YhcH/YjgK/YiaL family protein
MVLDALSHLNRYLDLHPRFRVIADAIASRNLAALLPNRYEIDGPRLYLSIDENDGRGHARARLESHRRYIDIQVTLAGAKKSVGDRYQSVTVRLRHLTSNETSSFTKTTHIPGLRCRRVSSQSSSRTTPTRPWRAPGG